jgi:hypothetical protein
MTKQNGKAKESSNDDGAPAASAEPKVGDNMPDGTVFAGISPDANKPMYVTPADESLKMTFNKAQKYASNLDAHGHTDRPVPPKTWLPCRSRWMI